MMHAIVNTCSHLQNASKARLGLTSVKHTKYNLRLLLAMQKAGFLSFVTRGSAHLPPDPNFLSTYSPEPLTAANASRQRLWLGLKYGASGQPVLGSMEAISKPKRRVTATLPDLERICRGLTARSSLQRGLNLGESLFVSTDRGVLEVREAVQRKAGGMLLCRVGPPMKP